MRTARQIMSDCGCYPTTHQDVIIEAMKQYAKEAIEEAANSAQILFHDGHHKTNKSLKYFQSGADNIQPDKQSILNLINELK